MGDWVVAGERPADTRVDENKTVRSAVIRFQLNVVTKFVVDNNHASEYSRTRTDSTHLCILWKVPRSSGSATHSHARTTNRNGETISIQFTMCQQTHSSSGSERSNLELHSVCAALTSTYIV